MPKVEEFCQFYNKRWSDTRRKRLRCASETLTLTQTLITNLMGYSKYCTVN
jgi:hypothetical protein